MGQVGGAEPEGPTAQPPTCISAGCRPGADAAGPDDFIAGRAKGQWRPGHLGDPRAEHTDGTGSPLQPGLPPAPRREEPGCRSQG